MIARQLKEYLKSSPNSEELTMICKEPIGSFDPDSWRLELLR